MEDDQKKAPQSKPHETFNANTVVLDYCDDAFTTLDILKDLLNALDKQVDRLEEAESDKGLENETRIARTLLGVVEEKAGELSRQATASREMLETILREISI